MCELQGDGHQGLLAVDEVRHHHSSGEADQPGAVEDHDAPEHRDHLQSLHLTVVAGGHVAGDDVWHPRVAETDAELADDESPQDRADAVSAGGKQMGADRSEPLDESAETAESGNGVEGQDDQGYRDQQALEEIGPRYRSEAAERGHEDDHRGANHHSEEVSAPALETER